MLSKFGRLAALALVALSSLSAAKASPIRAGFDATTLARNDDGSTGLVSTGLFMNFFGTLATQVFVNNNGSVTFTRAEGTFVPYGLNGAVTQPIIAPFFADVDTRFRGSPVTYGTGTVGGRTAFGVNWVNVSPYVDENPAATSPLRDNFQLVLIDRSDVSFGSFDIEFNYGAMGWDTGAASNGVSAQAGLSSGATGTHFTLTGSGVTGALLDGGVNALSTHSNMLPVPGSDYALGRYKFIVRNGVPAGYFTIPAVPVPATLPLLLVGPAAFAFLRQRARKA